MKSQYLILSFVFFAAISCVNKLNKSNGANQLQFLFKTKFDTVQYNYGQHIDINGWLPRSDSKELVMSSIDERQKFYSSSFTKSDRIKILGEYLTFLGDRTPSNQKYFFKQSAYMTSPENINGFTIQIEALFSFTKMLTEGIPPIKPTLIDCTTGEEVNTKPERIKEVYEIYRKWYQENVKSDFKNLTFPLDGSRYCWFGQDKELQLFLKKSL